MTKTQKDIENRFLSTNEKSSAFAERVWASLIVKAEYAMEDTVDDNANAHPVFSGYPFSTLFSRFSVLSRAFAAHTIIRVADLRQSIASKAKVIATQREQWRDLLKQKICDALASKRLLEQARQDAQLHKHKEQPSFVYDYLNSSQATGTSVLDLNSLVTANAHANASISNRDSFINAFTYHYIQQTLARPNDHNLSEELMAKDLTILELRNEVIDIKEKHNQNLTLDIAGISFEDDKIEIYNLEQKVSMLSKELQSSNMRAELTLSKLDARDEEVAKLRRQLGKFVNVGGSDVDTRLAALKRF